MSAYELCGIRHCYEEKVVLNFSNLRIDSQDIVGISGRNGSGKSTLLRLLAFLESPSYGEVKYDGERSEIAILLPEVHLLSRSVQENLEYMFKIRKKTICRQKIKEVLDLVGLEPSLFLHRSHFELSSGEKQRVGFAQRLLLNPKVLLLDEPTNNLDLSGLDAFSSALKWANQELKSTLVIISHDKKWLDCNSKRRLKLHFGALIAQNQAHLFSHNWNQTPKGEKFYEFGNGEFLHLPKSESLDLREGIVVAQEHILLSPKHGPIFRARVIGMRLDAQDSNQMILECKIGNEVLVKILPIWQGKEIKVFDEVEIGFDLAGILRINGIELRD